MSENIQTIDDLKKQNIALQEEMLACDAASKKRDAELEERIAKLERKFRDGDFSLPSLP